MSATQTAFQITLADFRERSRRYSFLVMLGFAFFFGYLVIVGKYSLFLGDCRGAHNSAWVGSLMAVVTVQFLVFFGFYLVKNCIGRDRQTGVGPIISASQITGTRYVITKFLSNVAVLGTIVAILYLSALVMFVVGSVAEDFDPVALSLPFLYSCLPAVFLAGALAIFFESVSWLSGIVGNILYIFLAELILLLAVFNVAPALDVSGISLYIPSMQEAASLQYPEARMGIEMGFVNVVETINADDKLLFTWQGIDWAPSMFLSRLVWIFVSIMLAWSSAFFFKRFDTSKSRRRVRRTAGIKERSASEGVAAASAPLVNYSDLPGVAARSSILALVVAEWRLLMSRIHWSWYLIGLVLIVLQLAIPYEFARSIAYPAAWLWPVAILSPLGNREFVHGTDRIVFSSGSSQLRQLSASWLAGLVSVALVTGGLIIRSAIMGNDTILWSWLAGCLFVPSLALILGTVSRSNKLFEIVYVLVWYIGPVNKAPALDFVGATAESMALGVPATLLWITLLVLPLSYLVRRQQSRN